MIATLSSPLAVERSGVANENDYDNGLRPLFLSPSHENDCQYLEQRKQLAFERAGCNARGESSVTRRWLLQLSDGYYPGLDHPMVGENVNDPSPHLFLHELESV